LNGQLSITEICQDINLNKLIDIPHVETTITEQALKRFRLEVLRASESSSGMFLNRDTP